MSELDEVAQAIYEQKPHFFPLQSYEQASALAHAELGRGESHNMYDALAAALMTLGRTSS